MREQRPPLGKRLRVVAASCVSLILVAGPGHSEGTEELPLLREKGCHACHSMDVVLLGPPYTAIAALHSARKEVMLEVLIEKIISGGGGNWGMAPMVPNDHVTEDEARAMTEWILSLEPLRAKEHAKKRAELTWERSSSLIEKETL
ncbi:MAG: c-type cytochrome [Gammaproteobacteria bacterium]|nr:c-type cytochrome [Gammaproteobacteria bacterium]